MNKRNTKQSELVTICTRYTNTIQLPTTRELFSLLKTKLQNNIEGCIAYLVNSEVFLYNLRSERVENIIPNVIDSAEMTFFSDHEVAVSIMCSRVFIFDMNLSRITKTLYSDDISGTSLLALTENVLVDSIEANELILWDTATNNTSKLRYGGEEDGLLDILKID